MNGCDSEGVRYIGVLLAKECEKSRSNDSLFDTERVHKAVHWMAKDLSSPKADCKGSDSKGVMARECVTSVVPTRVCANEYPW